jgi:hypothetical protein
MTADNGGAGMGLYALVESVLVEVRSLRTDTQNGFTAVNTRIDSVHDRLDSVNTRMDTVIDAVAGLRREFDQHTHE